MALPVGFRRAERLRSAVAVQLRGSAIMGRLRSIKAAVAIGAREKPFGLIGYALPSPLPAAVVEELDACFVVRDHA